MKHFSLVVLFLAAYHATSFAQNPSAINWISWEEAVKPNQTAPKKMMIDVYTDWCGWCKKMDKSTFVDPQIVKYVSDNFYAVKFNAEQRADIQFSSETFKFVANDNGRGGVHQLAVALLDGKMGYPSIVYLNEKFERIMISPGFKDPANIIKELKFASEEQYRKTTWELYSSEN